MQKVHLYYSEITEEHSNPHGSHPEDPSRIKKTMEILENSGTLDRLHLMKGREATPIELLLVHDPLYVSMLYAKKHSIIERKFNDIFMNKHTLKAASTSVGMSLDASFSVLLEDCKRAIVLCRPPGHHAKYDSAAGFCFFNNVVFAAKYLSAHKRVCIFDWDVHHGDGTASLVKGMPNVNLITVQRYDNGIFYPTTGGTYIDENISSVGFNGSINGKEYLELFTLQVLPLIKEAKPDVILVSAGFDTAKGDPLGGCTLESNDYAKMTESMLKITPNMIVLLEGGYNPEAVGNGINAVAEVLLNN